MKTLEITFTFLSPWHMGSGFGEGPNLDAVPVKSPAGLPFIPGRSVKGLFREAFLLAEECGRLQAGTTCRLFGSRDQGLSRYDSTAGCLHFDSATLGEAMEVWAFAVDEQGKRKNAGAVRQLFMTLSSTRIDEDGLACDKTLRKIEVALPVTLTARIEGADPDSNLTDALEIAASLIRQAGVHRHRGLGRVTITVKEVRS